MTDYYAGDLSPSDSLVSLEAADAILATTLYGREWTSRADLDRRACADDADRQPDRSADKAALRDASGLLGCQPWRGRPASTSQVQPFPRVGLTQTDGRVISGIPYDIAKATALLAVHLIAKADQPMSAETFRAYQTGEVRGEFRAPMRDDLPRQVRTLINQYLHGGTTWSPLTA